MIHVGSRILGSILNSSKVTDNQESQDPTRTWSEPKGRTCTINTRACLDICISDGLNLIWMNNYLQIVALQNSLHTFLSLRLGTASIVGRIV